MKLDVIKLDGGKAGSVDLGDEIFGLGACLLHRALDRINIVVHACHRAVRLDQLGAGLLANPLYAGDVVRRIAHQSL